MRALLAVFACSCALARASLAAPIAFVVAEPPGSAVHGDSYVLVLQDPADVAHARALIADGAAAGATIASAQIAAGADGVNRDVLAPGSPPWSWHVTAFEGFADAATEVCDGWPGFVEEDVAGWIANTGGRVCFWQYTVVQELPEPGGAALLAAGAAALTLARAAARRRSEAPAPRARAARPARTAARAAVGTATAGSSARR